MKNIVLIGFMGSGKTSVGKSVAEKLNMSFIDLDRWIEERETMSIKEIFDRKGEEVFRKIECEAVAEVGNQKNSVIATGGGVVLNPKNLESLKETGLLIHLRVDAQTAYKRTRDHHHRPLLNVPNPLQHIEALLKQRQPFYEVVPNAVETSGRSLRDVVEDVIRIYRSAKGVR